MEQYLNRPNQYKKILDLLKSLNLDIDVEEDKLFQVDTNRESVNCTFSNYIAGSLRRGIEFLNLLNPYVPNDNLEEFKKAFFSRYEDQELPLLQVLDQELGLGYLQNRSKGDISPLVDDVPVYRFSTQRQTFVKREIDELLLTKYVEAINENKLEISLPTLQPT